MKQGDPQNMSPLKLVYAPNYFRQSPLKISGTWNNFGCDKQLEVLCDTL